MCDHKKYISRVFIVNGSNVIVSHHNLILSFFIFSKSLRYGLQNTWTWEKKIHSRLNRNFSDGHLNRILSDAVNIKLKKNIKKWSKEKERKLFPHWLFCLHNNKIILINDAVHLLLWHSQIMTSPSVKITMNKKLTSWHISSCKVMTDIFFLSFSSVFFCLYFYF